MKNAPLNTESTVLALVKGFQDRSLPKERWTHEAHLTTAIWFHMNHTHLEAVCYLRSGIIAYNEATGGKNTHTDGYHETLTLFWCHTISEFVNKNQGKTLTQMCEAFLSSEMATRDYPLRFYSKERLFSLEARATWVAPQTVPA